MVRRGSGTSITPGGTLGGDQLGTRIAYRLNNDRSRPVSLSARLYAPLGNARAAEASVGVDWRPLATLPVHILAERRQRLGRDGRSAFSLTMYGGVDEQLGAGGLRLEAYGQAGLVGVRRRDPFVDGQVRLSMPVQRLNIGVGAWGAAQPGASRLDMGPQASVTFPIGSTTIRAAADYRFRIAGDAEPGSGPALTLSTGF